MQPIPAVDSLDVQRRRLALGALFGLAGCGGSGSAGAAPEGGAPRVVTVARGLAHPWGLAFLPDGGMLVTERAGRIRRVAADGSVSAPLAGVPAVRAVSQGGLLDIALDPDFATDPWVYWSYSEPGEGGTAGTAVARGRLAGGALQAVSVIYRQTPKVAGGIHFGSRLVFTPDKLLFVTLGDRGQDSPSNPGTGGAQSLSRSLGKVVRLTREGAPAPGNPSFDGAGALPEIYSYGHRNAQSAALHPANGELWVVEHGPQGGDELNRVLPGRNYGWPLRSYGCPYGSPVGEACRAGGGTHAPEFEEPLTTWVPTSTAPSGMAFYTGERIPEWRGNLFVGSLADRLLWRLTLSGNQVTARERLFESLGERIRDVRQGPDGWLYLLTDASDGRVLRVER